jgi:general L-amino acid transport system substrate-binding protein
MQAMAYLRLLFISLLMVMLGAVPAQAGTTADGVVKKGFVQCGVNTGLAGFSQPDSNGEWRGIDVDLCRAVAAAMCSPTPRKFGLRR